MDMTLFQGTISSLNLAGKIAKSFLELKSLTDVQGKVIELQSVILSAQGDALAAQAQQTAMIEEIRNLKEEIARVKAWEEQKQRYKLISPWEGTLLYALKEECCASEPAHWICTKCYEDGRKSILNPKQQDNDTRWLLVCPVCKYEFYTPHRRMPVAEYAPK